MTKMNVARLVLASAAAAALSVACSASSEPQGTAHEETRRSEQALSCSDFLNANSTVVYQPGCGSLLETQSAPDATYGDGSCQYYGAEWDGTDYNPSGRFTVTVGAPIGEAACATAGISYTVYGLVETTNAPRFGNPYWNTIVSNTVNGGTWDGSACRFPSANFSDAAPVANTGTLPRYVDTKVFAQAYVTTTVKGATSRGYSPVVITLQPQGC